MGYKGIMSRSSSLAFLILCLASPAFGVPDTDPNQGVRTTLQSEMEDFSLPDWNHRPATFPGAASPSPFVPAAGPAVEGYRKRLAGDAPWQGGPVWHQMGSLSLGLKSGKAEMLGINVFQPPGISKGTLLFLHGYMAHAGDFAYTLAWFVNRGWTVVTLDLPGHGLSQGRRADIDDFGVYGDAVELWLKWAFDQGWPGPRVLVAHSLGAAASLEALRRPGASVPDRVVFCAPLLRTDWYPALWFADFLVGGWFPSVPGIFGWDGYLDGYAASVHWFHALGNWLAVLDKQTPLELPLTVYCGDRDSVVDASWNEGKYRTLVPGVRWVTLVGKDHWFLSGKEDREAFHERLTKDLGY